MNGDGSAEYAEIDRDYHGVVRFRDFHKYLLSKAKANDSEQSSDSSDYEDEVDVTARALWVKLDPMHRCYVHIDRAVD